MSEPQNPSIAVSIARAPAQCDIGQELPTEIMQDCFRMLDLRGRIAVSHVSRGWRAVALNDRGLWNNATAPYTSGRCGADMLRALLARSDPLPFSFSSDRLSGACLDLVRQPAPMLEKFDGQDTDGPAELATLWPVIKVLRLRSIRILPTSPQRFAAVTLFSCSMVDPFINAGISVFSVFPALKSLSIGYIVQEEVALFSDPPDCLSELSIGAAYDEQIDYAPVLRACRGLRLQTLQLESARDAAAIVECFSEFAQAPWLMDVDGRDGVSVELRDDAQGRVWSFTCGYDARISFMEPRLASCLTQLGHLTTSAALFVQLHNLVGWSRSLPALRSLTLKMLHPVPNSVPSPCANPPVSMPQLGSFTLWLDDMSDEMQELLEHLLPALPAVIERAPTVVLDVDNANDLLTCNLKPLSAITEELRVQERSSGKTTVSPHRGPDWGFSL